LRGRADQRAQLRRLREELPRSARMVQRGRVRTGAVRPSPLAMPDGTVLLRQRVLPVRAALLRNGRQPRLRRWGYLHSLMEIGAGTIDFSIPGQRWLDLGERAA